MLRPQRSSSILNALLEANAPQFSNDIVIDAFKAIETVHVYPHDLSWD